MPMNKNKLSISISILLISSSLYAAQQTTLIETPFGLRPNQCSHTHPTGTTVRETPTGVEAKYPNGTIKKFPKNPECIKYQNRWLAESARFKHRESSESILKNGWLDNAYWYPPSPMSMLSGNYRVPNNPVAQGKTYWLYYFLGVENFQSDIPVSILQPVLSWSAKGWKFASWNCCPQGQVHSATPVKATANDVVQGKIQQQGTTWIIDAISANMHSTLNVEAANRIFNYVDATLETYDIADCTYFPTLPMTFSQIVVQLANGQTASPVWKTTGPTQCSGITTANSPTKVKISHN